ncbi:hypothetical protein [Glycomyces sp. NPDC021274]|uniref:hypothetical protein n=1 Tax=Glycomyces sp. NPDC021274 TaxID=3155120 RepID=UPI003403E290
MAEEEIETHEGPAEHEAKHYQQTTRCHADGCSLGRAQADTDWESLMAGVYQDGTSFKLENSGHRYAAPDEATFQAVLAAVRPSEKHAIYPMIEAWKQVGKDLTDFEERHKYNIEQLSKFWTGDDFDSFSDTNDELKTLIFDTVDKIDSVATSLEQAGQEIYAQQGGDSGHIPFPEPQYYVKNGGCGDAKIHFRPPWHSGDCEIMDDEKAAFWFGGGAADGGTGDGNTNWGEEMFVSANEWREGRVNYLVQNGMDQAEAQSIAESELDDWIFYEREDVAEALKSASERTADDINTRKTNQETGVNETDYDATPGKPPEIVAGEELEQPPNLTNPSPPGSPSIPGGMGDMPSAKPPGDFSSDLGTPDSPPGLGSGTGGGLGNGTYNPGIDTGGLDSDNPWDSNVPDPDDISGGLASGGGLSGGGLGGGGLPGGGGPGGGLGGGAGAGGGLGGGMGAGMGGMMGGAGGGRGAGAGAGGGRGAGGRGAGGPKGMGKGMGGGMGGMMGGAGGGRGMGGQGEGEQEAGTWLTEDEDVWGIGNEEEDPYS